MIPHVNESKEELDQIDLTYGLDKPEEIKLFDQILLNRPLKVVAALILTAIIAPLLIYHFVFFSGLDQPPSDGLSFGSCLVPREARLLCGVGAVTSEECHSQCCYDYTNNMCFHRFPSRFSYITHRNWTEDTLLSPRVPTVPFSSQRSLTTIRLSIDEVSPTHLSLNFYHSEVVLEGRRLDKKEYAYEVSYPELNVIVNASERNIFNTIRGPLIASNDIWEISFKITEDVMFGLGEIPLKEDMVKVIYNHNEGLSGVPLIYGRSNGSYHGLLVDNVAPSEISFRGENQIVVRSITRYGLKLHLFVGPRPVDVMKDVMELMGSDRKLDYWMLGAHVCSETSESKHNVSVLTSFLSAANTQQMPFDSHCGIAPIVFENNRNNSAVKLIKQGATALKNAGKRFVPHVSPYIRYTELNETDKNGTDTKIYQSNDNIKDLEQYIMRDSLSLEFYKGRVGNYDVVYPNYQNISKEFMEQLWVYDEVDSLVLENSWPLDESDNRVNETYKFLPYFSENFEVAFTNTPQWNATKPNGERYLYTHNEYGNHFASAFKNIQDPISILTTSQRMLGNVAINRQNIQTSWSSLQRELIEASLGGVSGHWLWSSPICGDTGSFDNHTQTRLCAKWYMASTYMPLIKIHSKQIGREPLSFVGTHRRHMLNALNVRLSLLPYFYTVLQEGPLLRPMFYQFPSSKELSNLTTQFAVGDDLLIVPNLQPSQSHVHVTMPPGTWYEFWSGMRIDADEGDVATMTTTEAEFLTLIRGGTIVAMQKDVRLTAEDTRRWSPFSFKIALHCTQSTRNDTNNSTICSAIGKIHLSYNMTINLKSDDEQLYITATGDDFISFCDSTEAFWTNNVKEIIVYGLGDDKNNYDHHRFVNTDIDLCRLKYEEEIIENYLVRH